MKSYKEFKQEMSEKVSIDELSNELLGRYKTAAGVDAAAAAAAADKAVQAGDKQALRKAIDRGNKRFSGTIQATKKEFDNTMKKYSEEVELGEAKAEPMKLYHPSYSAALAHAKEHLNKRGFDISDEDWFHHISSGPVKPAENQTNRLSIPLTNKGGSPTKKMVHIQVHNRGDKLPNNHELNMYVDK